MSSVMFGCYVIGGELIVFNWSQNTSGQLRNFLKKNLIILYDPGSPKNSVEITTVIVF